MSVWYAIPSARPLAEAQACFEAWAAIGCRTAAVRDDPRDAHWLKVDLCVALPKYPGWAGSINHLAKQILELDPGCAVVATGGDDVWPDAEFPAERMERELVDHFGGTLGVIQPIGGEPWTREVIDGRNVMERIAWAPWLGRAWCERGYGGRGPMWPEYWHMFADQDLWTVARLLDLYWERRDVKQEHRCWKMAGYRTDRPAFLEHADAAWHSDKAIYMARKAADFPDRLSLA